MIGYSAESSPRHTAFLTPPPEGMQPCVGKLPAHDLQRPDVPRYRMVVEVALKDRAKPFSLFRYRQVASLHEASPDLFQLRSHPLADAFAPDVGIPLLGLAEVVGEAEKVECLRFAFAMLASPECGVFAEINEPRLFGMQLQGELVQPLSEVLKETLRVPLLLEPHDTVVRVSDDHHIAASVLLPPPVGPKVESIVEVDIPEQGRDRSALWRTLLRLLPLTVLDDSGLKPLLDEPEHAAVSDTVLERFDQPSMIETTEIVLNVCVEHHAHLTFHYPHPERIQRVMLAAPRTEAVAEPLEFNLIDLVEYERKRLLDKLVLQRRYAQGALASVRFGDVHPPAGFAAVSSAVHLAVQLGQPGVEDKFVFPPRHIVHTGACRALQLVEAFAQQLGRKVMQQGGELRTPVPACRFPHAQKALHRSCPALCPDCGRPLRVSLDCRPSLRRLRWGADGLASGFRRRVPGAALSVLRRGFTFPPWLSTCPSDSHCSSLSSVLLRHPTPRRRARRVHGFRLSLPALAISNGGASARPPRFPRSVSMHARGLRPRDSRLWLAFAPSAVSPSASLNGVGLSNSCFRGSIHGLHVPLSTLRMSPHDNTHMTRGRSGWLGLLRGDFPSPALQELFLALLSVRRAHLPRRIGSLL